MENNSVNDELGHETQVLRFLQQQLALSPWVVSLQYLGEEYLIRFPDRDAAKQLIKCVKSHDVFTLSKSPTGFVVCCTYIPAFEAGEILCVFYTSLLLRLSDCPVNTLCCMEVLNAYMQEAPAKLTGSNLLRAFEKFRDVFVVSGDSVVNVRLHSSMLYQRLTFHLRKYFTGLKAFCEKSAITFDKIFQHVTVYAPPAIREHFARPGGPEELRKYIQQNDHQFSKTKSGTIHLVARHTLIWLVELEQAARYFHQILYAFRLCGHKKVCFNVLLCCVREAEATVKFFLKTEFPSITVIDFFQSMPEYFDTTTAFNCVAPVCNGSLETSDEHGSLEMATVEYYSTLLWVTSTQVEIEVLQLCVQYMDETVKTYCLDKYATGIAHFFSQYPKVFKISKDGKAVGLGLDLPRFCTSDKLERKNYDCATDAIMSSRNDLMSQVMQGTCLLKKHELLTVFLRRHNCFVLENDKVVLANRSQKSSSPSSSTAKERPPLTEQSDTTSTRPPGPGLGERDSQKQEPNSQRFSELLEIQRAVEMFDELVVKMLTAVNDFCLGTKIAEVAKKASEKQFGVLEQQYSGGFAGYLATRHLFEYSRSQKSIRLCLESRSGTLKNESCVGTVTEVTKKYGMVQAEQFCSPECFPKWTFVGTSVCGKLSSHLKTGDTVEVQYLCYTASLPCITSVIKVVNHEKKNSSLVTEDCKVVLAGPYYALLGLKNCNGVAARDVIIVYTDIDRLSNLKVGDSIKVQLRPGYPSETIWKAYKLKSENDVKGPTKSPKQCSKAQVQGSKNEKKKGCGSAVDYFAAVIGDPQSVASIAALKEALQKSPQPIQEFCRNNFPGNFLGFFKKYCHAFKVSQDGQVTRTLPKASKPGGAVIAYRSAVLGTLSGIWEQGAQITSKDYRKPIAVFPWAFVQQSGTVAVKMTSAWQLGDTVEFDGILDPKQPSPLVTCAIKVTKHIDKALPKSYVCEVTLVTTYYALLRCTSVKVDATITDSTVLLFSDPRGVKLAPLQKVVAKAFPNYPSPELWKVCSLTHNVG